MLRTRPLPGLPRQERTSQPGLLYRKRQAPADVRRPGLDHWPLRYYPKCVDAKGALPTRTMRVLHAGVVRATGGPKRLRRHRDRFRAPRTVRHTRAEVAPERLGRLVWGSPRGGARPAAAGYQSVVICATARCANCYSPVDTRPRLPLTAGWAPLTGRPAAGWRSRGLAVLMVVDETAPAVADGVRRGGGEASPVSGAWPPAPLPVTPLPRE